MQSMLCFSFVSSWIWTDNLASCISFIKFVFNERTLVNAKVIKMFLDFVFCSALCLRYDQLCMYAIFSKYIPCEARKMWIIHIHNIWHDLEPPATLRSVINSYLNYKILNIVRPLPDTWLQMANGFEWRVYLQKNFRF